MSIVSHEAFGQLFLDVLDEGGRATVVQRDNVVANGPGLDDITDTL